MKVDSKFVVKIVGFVVVVVEIVAFEVGPST